MKFNTTFPKELKSNFEKELLAYENELNKNNLKQAWKHLETAHVIGQSFPYEHTYVHWKMLQFGFKIKSTKEILGQFPRLLIGGVKSFVGKVPIGNTGGANVPPMRSMPIDAEIEKLFKNVEIVRR